MKNAFLTYQCGWSWFKKSMYTLQTLWGHTLTNKQIPQMLSWPYLISSKGDEITFDYKFERYGQEAQKCYCGASNCRGWLGGSPDKKRQQQQQANQVPATEKRTADASGGGSGLDTTKYNFIWLAFIFSKSMVSSDWPNKWPRTQPLRKPFTGRDRNVGVDRLDSK